MLAVSNVAEQQVEGDALAVLVLDVLVNPAKNDAETLSGSLLRTVDRDGIALSLSDRYELGGVLTRLTYVRTRYVYIPQESIGYQYSILMSPPFPFSIFHI